MAVADNETLGQRIRRLREAAGLPQRAVAEALRERGHDVKNGANVGTWERDEWRPGSAAVVGDLERILGAEPGELLVISGYVYDRAAEVLQDPDATTEQRSAASIALMQQQLDDLSRRVSVLESERPTPLVADRQFASAADSGNPDARVVRDEGPVRRRVGPMDEGE